MKMTLKDNDSYSDKEAAKILGVPVETIREWHYFGLGDLKGEGSFHLDADEETSGAAFKRALLHLDDPDYLNFRKFSLNLRRVSDALQKLNNFCSHWVGELPAYALGHLKSHIDTYIRVLKECFGTNEAFENWRYEVANLPTPDQLLKRYADICENADKLPK